jgi:hypothetical protein
MAGRVGCDSVKEESLARHVFCLSGSWVELTVSARGHQGALEAKDDVAVRPAKSLK